MKTSDIVHKIRPRHLLWLLAPVLMWWALKDIRWEAVGAVLVRLTVWQILVLAAINLAILIFFSIGWWLILRAVGCPVPLRTLTAYRLAAFGVSYFTPGPQIGGEPLQVYLLHRNHGVAGPAAAAATGLDRGLELLVNFVVLAAGIALVGQWDLWPGASPTGALAVVALAALAIAGFLWSSWNGWLPLTRVLHWLPFRAATHSRLVGWAAEAERQATEFCRQNPRTLAAVMVFSVMNWILILVEYWLGMYFLGLPLTLRQLVTAVTINRLAFLAPLPAGLGVLEAGQILAMTLLGLDPTVGVSEGLIIRVRDTVMCLAGLWVGWRAARR